MKDYEEINKNIRNWLEEIINESGDSINPETLYRNIYNSTGDENSLAQIFEVPVGLVRAIKDENK